MFIISVVDEQGKYVYSIIKTEDIRDCLLVGMNLHIVDTYYTIIDSHIDIFEDFESILISLQVKRYNDGIPINYKEV